MNYRIIFRLLGQILLVEAVFLLPSAGLCFFDGQGNSAAAFLLSALACAVCGSVFFLIGRKANRTFFAREGFVCVGLSWIVMSLFGALPFFLSGEIPSYLDALFEIVSGFTTTGSSILPNVEMLSRGALLWRSFSHWLGGMGVLVFLLAIAPGEKGGFSLHLLRAESPGPNVGKLVPKMKRTALILYLLYIVLTVCNLIFLLCGDMPWFDALCTAFGTAGTGGFGIRADSMASYSPYLQTVTTVFMFLFGVNFTLYYWAVLRQFRSIAKNEEIRLYLGLAVLSTAVIAWNIAPQFGSVRSAIHHAAFQVSSVMTTTGFSTADFNAWPNLSKTILLLLMIIGACAGSTGGGLKCARMVLLWKSFKRNIRKILHPQSVKLVRADGVVVNEEVMKATNLYLVTYTGILLFSWLVISFDGFDIETNLSAVFSCFNNIGPGLGVVGPMGNFAAFGVVSKLVLIFDMLAGRLELFPILVLLAPSTWRRR